MVPGDSINGFGGSVNGSRGQRKWLKDGENGGDIQWIKLFFGGNCNGMLVWDFWDEGDNSRRVMNRKYKCATQRTMP